MRLLDTLAVTFVCASTSAQTTVSGGIFSDATWTLNGSPYHVTGNVVLFDTYTLTIEPGVVVEVDAGVTIELRNSRLVAIGTASDPITFKKASVPKWGGFIAVGNSNPLFTGNQVQMEHCIGKDAVRFMELDIAYHTPYNFLHCEFANNTTAFWEGPVSFVQGQYNFTACSFHDNGTALQGGYFYTTTDCSFTNNDIGSDGGSWVTGCTFTGNDLALDPSGYIDGNTFIGNAVAVESNWNATNDVFTNNVVVGNEKGVRMGTYFNGSQDFSGNTICRNTLWNIERYAAGGNNTANLGINCFCSSDAAAIEQTIYHAVDDLTVGLIVFSPFATDQACLEFNVGMADLASIDFTAYPNPTGSLLNIAIPNDYAAGTMLTVLSSTGQAVLSQRLFGPVTQVDLSDVPNGSFVVMLQQEERLMTGRVVVMH